MRTWEKTQNNLPTTGMCFTQKSLKPGGCGVPPTKLPGVVFVGTEKSADFGVIAPGQRNDH